MLIRTLVGLTAVLVAAGSHHPAGHGDRAHPPASARPSASASAGPSASAGAPGAGAGSRQTCTVRADNPRQAAGAKPGDVVCFSGKLSGRLTITKGGTADKPITYAGNGQSVGGITIKASNVVVDGYHADKPSAPGIEMTGDNITVQNNTVSQPQGGDGDGLRFFGNNLKILHNTISRTSNTDKRHADCMQTFASDTPASQHVLIEGNRCEQIDNMCLMAEGPNDGEGDGHGHTLDFTIRGNFCETLKASQTLMIEDVQHCTITNNEFAAAPNHAIGLAIHSTDAHVSGNKVSPRIRYEVGIDKSSMKGYQGPRPGGQP